MLDVRRLRVLKEVAEQGSFSAAAESLAYTQSAVSQQIAALERESGTTLVDRGPRGIRLTDAGRALVQHAEDILCRLGAAEAELEAIAGLRGGRVRLSAFPTAGATIVPLAVKTFMARHPGVEMQLFEREPEDGVAMLKSGELDIALSIGYEGAGTVHNPTDGVEEIDLLEDPTYLAMPADHRYARKARTRLSDFSEESWIHSACKGTCGAVALRALHNAGFEPTIVFETDDYNVAQGLVAAGMGVTLLPEMALRNLREDIIVRPLGTQVTHRRIMACLLQGAYRSPATDAMLGILHEAVGEHTMARAELAA
ncbi:MAG TPA: LysR family transcriptional regulator [Solirubrobacteraceae bacterium]|jgi:DNA-binding transcriptional LysR family regulator|nr:LysR family transcriptional regulator [Solirubrobacteraceae bacterium]